MKSMSAMIAMCITAVASGQFTEDRKLTAADGEVFDWFGASVAICGSHALIGSRFDGDAGDNAGSAYLFDTATGEQLRKLIASDAEPNALFGNSVAISGTTAIVGALKGSGSGVRSGVAYVFDTATGQELFKLTPSDGAGGDDFGVSVAISGTTAIVGAYVDDDGANASGSAYLFDTTTGQQLFKLTAADPSAVALFGWSVAICGSTAIVGANNANSSQGAAYVFDTTTGQQMFKLTAPDPDSFDRFGDAVAISGDRAIVGMRGSPLAGRVFVFDTTTGQLTGELAALDGPVALFGFSVALSGSRAVIGAYGDSVAGPFSGSAYIFDVETGHQLFKLTASDASARDDFGFWVDTADDSVIVGSRKDDDGTGLGAAYIFDVPASCPGDIADDFGTLPPMGGPDGMVSFGDFLALLGLVGPCPDGTSGCTGDIADDFGTLGGDGMVSFGDFLALLGLVGPCP